MRIQSFYPIIVTPRATECRDFYRTWFGLEVVFEASWFVLLGPGDGAATVAFMTPDHPSAPPGREAFSSKGMCLEFQVGDAAAEHARFAETGHLVLCTLHANNANQAMDRILHFFPEDRRAQLLMDLSLNLKGVVAQQLIPTPDGKARRVAMEVLLGTPLVQDYIRDGEIHKLKEVMKESTQLGMKTFDQALFELYQAGEISYEDALRFADSANEVRLKIKLAQGGDARTLSQGMDGIEVAEVR